jgi:hypothetical protein
MKDGYSHYCKECVCEARRKSYDYNYESKWRIPYSEKTQEQKRKTKLSINKWKTKNSAKCNAYKSIFIALRAGKLTRSPHCMTCGITCKTEAHHWKGYEPKHHLDVIWLCKSCHGAHDRLIRHNHIWPYDELPIVEFPVVSHPLTFGEQ